MAFSQATQIKIAQRRLMSELFISQIGVDLEIRCFEFPCDEEFFVETYDEHQYTFIHGVLVDGEWLFNYHHRRDQLDEPQTDDDGVMDLKHLLEMYGY